MNVSELEREIERLRIKMENTYAEANDAFREAGLLAQQYIEAIDELNSFKCALKKEK